MATIFRRPGRPYWVAEYRDHTGRLRQRSTQTSDHEDAQLVADRFQTEAVLRRRGIIDPRADACARAAREPWTKHLADFISGAKAREVSDQQVQQLETRITRMLKLARLDGIGEISAHAVERAIADLRRGDREHRPASLQTATHYVRAVKQFTRWLVREARLASDPLAGMGSLGNPETDRKRVRRTLADEELTVLLRVTEHGPKRRKMSGTDRAMMYRTAFGTGFRLGELKSVTPESFDLRAVPPTVTVQAAYSKHRQTDVQPISSDLAAVLEPWVASKHAGKPVFPLRDKGVHILRPDLEAARAAWLDEARTAAERTEREKSSFLLYVDSAGKVADFHSLRHTYIDCLVAGGASVKTCQELARHSNPLLTIGRYSHVRLNDLTGALSVLPCPAPTRPPLEAQELQATGTCNDHPFEAKCDMPVNNGLCFSDRFGTEKHGIRTETHDVPSISERKRGFDACAKKAPVGGTGAIG